MNDGVKVGDSSISITNDGGAHWISNGALPVDTAFIGSGITNFILNSYEVVGNTIWLGDVYGYFYKSNDRGVTWIRMLNNIFPNSIKGIAFKDSLNGMVAASHYVGGGSGSSGGTNVDESFFTNDGGVTWNPMPIHFNSPNVDDQSAKYDVAYVPGTNNTFIVTSEYDATVAAFSGITYDGGLNWSLIDSTQQHTVCVFTSPTNGYSGGYIPSFFEGIYKWNGNLSVGINEKQNQEFISVFPNPAYDKLTIILNKTFVDELQEIQIINTLGKIVLEYKINELKDAEINLELSSLPEGLFIINAQTNDFNNHTYKFTHIH